MNMKTKIAICVGILVLLVSIPAYGAVETNTVIPFNFTFDISGCHEADQHIDVTGELHLLTATTINKNSFHLLVMNNPQGLTGTGRETGDLYHFTGITRFNLNENGVLEFPVTFTFENDANIVGPRGVGVTEHDITHTTVNADGTTTSTFERVRIRCRTEHVAQ
jgi:hypothetical protein